MLTQSRFALEGFENEQLLKNLQAIGPVKIDPTTTKMRTVGAFIHAKTQ